MARSEHASAQAIDRGWLLIDAGLLVLAPAGEEWSESAREQQAQRQRSPAGAAEAELYGRA